MNELNVLSSVSSFQRARKANFLNMVGETCMAARKAAGLTRPELAAQCMLTADTIAALEEGRSAPSLVLALVAHALDVSLDALVPVDAIEVPR